MDSNIYIYQEEIRPIDSIEFSIIGNEEVRNMSVIDEIDDNGLELPDLYDGSEPKRGGLIDTRMGTTDHHIHCSECGLDSTHCVGHFGHIKLEDYVFNIIYINSLKKVLSSVCIKCSRLYVGKNEDELEEMLKNKSNKKRWDNIKNITKNVNVCPVCGTAKPTIRMDIKKKDMSIRFYAEFSASSDQNEENSQTPQSLKKKIRQALTAEACYNICKNISDKHSLMMGLKSRPENMIQKMFPVPPVAIRPSAKVDFMSSSTSEDDLTHKLADIIKTNNKMRKHRNSSGEPGKYSLEHSNALQYDCANYYDNESTSLPKSEKKGKPFRSLTYRLKGKEGRVRGNLMGKRVDFSARTVITGDTTIGIDELRVPVRIAKILTFPEVVTPYNIIKMQELVRNGRDKYPGANFVFPLGKYDPNSNDRVLPIDLRYRKEQVKLEFGDIVERHIVDGDYVLLNRQPTLHKLSMMSHKIRVINDESLSTFGLCPNTTKPYNADFDGDEMNIFVPQSIQSQIELAEIANVRFQIISPRTSGPCIGAIQDNLLGAYNLTNPSIKIEWKDAMNIISYTSLDDFSILKKSDCEGSKLFSLIIPGKINFNIDGLHVKNGNIEKGVVKSSHIGNKVNSITHFIWNEYGPNETANFLNNLQKLVNNFNLYNGFTVGIGDLEISKETSENIIKIIEKKKLEVYHSITEMENNPDLLDLETFEDSIKDDLNSVGSNLAVMVMNDLKPTNNFNIQITSGARGEGSNMSQMIACLGQQSVENKRIRKKNNGRATAYNYQNDDSAYGRGFIFSPYVKGLSPLEFIYHNMAAREGLIDTAIKTAETGYIQRKIIKALEDIYVCYDGTIRNSNGTIYQFVYGDDGVDSTRQYFHDIKILEYGNSEIKDKYIFNNNDIKKYNISEKENKQLYDEIIYLRNLVRKSKVSTDLYNTVLDTKCILPVNITLIINNIINNRKSTTIINDAKYIINKINDILSYNNTKIFCMDGHDSKNINGIKYKDELLCKTLLKLVLFEYLSPKVVINELKLSKEDFDEICDRIINNFNKSIVEPGEMVGIIAAQSIGEPTTQMTLNTFHHTGVGAKGTANLGTPRIKEIMSLSSNLKTPIMNIHFNKEYMTNQIYVSKVESHIKYTQLSDICSKTEVFFDPNMFDKDSIMAKDNIKKTYHPYNITKYSCQKDISNLPWLIRIELNKDKMMESNVTLLDVKNIICSNWESRHSNKVKKEDTKMLEKISYMAVLSNNDNDNLAILHIRFDMSTYDYDIIKEFINNYIETIKLKGIPNITNANISSQRMVNFDNPDEKYECLDKVFVIYTKGINMIDIRYINGIDLNKTISNDIVNIYKVFGIEAARLTLIKELGLVFSKLFVSPQHISVLVDLMTNTGELTSIDRHGINKLDTDPLMRASFEKTTEQLVNAGIFNEIDHMNSVSSRIMAGLVIKGGTGMCNLVLDTNMLMNSEYIDDIENKYRKTFVELQKDSVIEDIVNDTETDMEEDNETNFFIPS